MKGSPPCIGNRNLSLLTTGLINNSRADVGFDHCNGFINISAPSPEPHSLATISSVLSRRAAGLCVPCIPSPGGVHDCPWDRAQWSHPCQLELATLVLTAPGTMLHTRGMYAPGEGEEWRGMAKPLQVHPGLEQMDREGNLGRRFSGLLPSPSLDQACPCSSALLTYGEEVCSPFPLCPGSGADSLCGQARWRLASCIS